MKKLNSSEIAKLAGVSRSTVSRVINGYTNVPDTTREHVMKVIRENEYYPMLSGQLLAGKNTNTLGLFWITGSSLADDLQGCAYLAHLTECAAERGYLVLTSIVKNLSAQENVDWIKRIFMQGRIDAGIFIGADNNEPLIEELISKGKVVGVFDYYRPDLENPNLITVNFETNTGGKAIDYVYSLGHRKIAIIDGNMNRFSSVKRHESFISAMQRHNIVMRREWMYYADVTENGGYAATKELLSTCAELPTVICANNDYAAIGVYKALGEAQISIPEDVSIIGIDGYLQGQYLTPPLTTYAFDIKHFFSSLAERTIAAVNHTDDNPSTEFFTSTLVERGSCKYITD